MRNGGVSKKGHRNKPISDGTVYFIPEVASRMFSSLSTHLLKFSVMSNFQNVLDACCGDKVLGRAIEERLGFAKVTYQDISISGKSIVDEIKKPEFFDIIVCNPPWKESIATEIYFHLLKLLKPGGVLFFIINNVWMYQGPDRARKILCDKFYFLPRYVFKWSGKSLLDCGVLVYEKKQEESSVYIDIPRDVHTLRFEEK